MQDISLIRTVVLLGHSKSGKTSLAEALLFTAGKTKRLGKVDDGNSTLDYEPEETKRQASINAAFHQYSWKKHSIFIIDAPGDDNFLNDAKFAASVADCAIFPVNATSGTKFQTSKIAGFAADKNLPVIFVVNEMDKERANYANTVEAIKSDLPQNSAALQLPTDG